MKPGLRDWLESQGASVGPLDLTHGDEGERGVVATAAILKGDVLLAVPLACTLHLPASEDELSGLSIPPAGAKILLSQKGASPLLASTLLLLAEQGKGGSSNWAAYLDSLPSQPPPCAALWNDEERGLLKGTSIEDTGIEVKALFDSQVSKLTAAHARVWPNADWPTFRSAAALVRSRAFSADHLSSGLSSGGASSSPLYLLPGIDLVNHASDPFRRNAAMSLRAAADGTITHFTLLAERDIAPGEEVLHCYGELSDAALLAQYGFIDSPLEPLAAAAGGRKGRDGKSRGSDKGRKGSRGSKDAAASLGDDTGSSFINPANSALVHWADVLGSCQAVLASVGQKDKEGGASPSGQGQGSLQGRKIAFLSSAGVLQPAAPTSTCFVSTLADPLPDELLTAVQVLVMMEDEFKELVAEYEQGKQGGAGGSGSGSTPQGQPPAAPAPAPAPLRLGLDLLEADAEFAELVAIALLQVVARCTARYATPPAQTAQAAREAAAAAASSGDLCSAVQRRAHALHVVLSEQVVLCEAKMEASALLLAAQAAQDGESDEGDEGEEGEEDGVGRGSKRRRLGLGAKDDGVDSEGGGYEDDDATDDSDKVGYGEVDYDDGIGEAHDRGHPAA